MPRNNKLELEFVSTRKWKTTDGRFGVIRMLKPLNPTLVSETPIPKYKYYFSIRDLREFELPGNLYELAREIGKVDVYKNVFPWLGEYTGEGSFDTDEPQRTKPKGMVEAILKMKAEILMMKEDDGKFRGVVG